MDFRPARKKAKLRRKADREEQKRDKKVHLKSREPTQRTNTNEVKYGGLAIKNRKKKLGQDGRATWAETGSDAQRE